MTILFMGGEMDAFTPADAVFTEIVATNKYNSSFCRCAFGHTTTGGTTSYVESAVWSTNAITWFHFDWTSQLTAVNCTLATAYSGSTAFARLRVIGDISALSVTFTQQYWNGSAWVDAGTAEVAWALNTFDWLVDVTNGALALYVSGTNRISTTGLSLSGYTGTTKLRLHQVVQPSYFSQVIAADESTIGWKLLTRYPNGAGATTDWTGDYTGVDEIVYSDADFDNSATADQVELFTQTGPTITGYIPRAVCVSARAKRGASGPANLRLALRASGTTYFSSGDKALDVGYGPFQTIWEDNPATTADWLAAAIDALQPGMKSIT